MEKIIVHYDGLLQRENDPVLDPPELKAYMDLWDGAEFLGQLQLTKEKSVLEIGVGTGRLAVRVAPQCGFFCGVDVAPKTIARAREHLSHVPQTQLICEDFMTHDFSRRFDVIYSSLTFMHIENKQAAVDKIAGLLKDNGRFILSIDKNQNRVIDAGFSQIQVYPDTPEEMALCIQKAHLRLEKQYETAHAHVFVCGKNG